MLIRDLASHAAGQAPLQFPFEGISGSTPSMRRYGAAAIAMDGESGYRITAIRLHAQRRGGPDRTYLPGDDKFAELSRVLIAERGDEIAAALNAAFMRRGFLTSQGHTMPRFVMPASLAA